MAGPTDTRQRARRRELAGHDERALELYETALRESRTARDAGTDPGLCVRVAEVHSRLGHTRQALDLYREAVDLYVDQGLIPNALSVLERLVALYPDRLEFRQRMVELQLEMGQIGSARTQLLRYLEALRERGDGERAEQAVAEFGEQFGPDDVLDGRARALVDEAHERTYQPPPELPEKEEEEPEPAEEAGPAEKTAAGGEIGPAGDDEAAPFEETAPPDTVFGLADDAGAAIGEEAREEADPAVEQQLAEEDAGEDRPAEAADASGDEAAGDEGDDIPDLAELRGREQSLQDILELEGPGGPGTETVPGGGDAGTGGIRATETGETAEATDVPDAPDLSAVPGAELSPEEEELGVEAELRQGLQILEDLLELAPDRLDLHRRKVAYARRLGDGERLREAYLALATGLSGACSRGARLLFERVLELDPDNSKALSGLARLDASELEDKKSQGEDAAAGNHPPRMTEATDHQTRQELGEVLWAEFEESVRQLPWLDGATQTFQAAGSEFLPPLPAFEMLGRYLLAREKNERAARVLSLPLEIEEYSDEELVDVLFHLSRAYERLGREQEARAIRDRVAEVDPDFSSILSMVPAEEASREESPEGDSAEEEAAEGDDD